MSLHTTSLKRVEEDKMYASNREWPNKDVMVAAVGGRARRLVEALRMTKRGRVGRTLPNLEQTPNGQTRAGRQEVGTPHGWAQASEILRPGLGVYKLGEDKAEASPSCPILIVPLLNL